MFDTMTMTKATGALCGSLLVFMLGGWVSKEIYGPDKGHHGEDGHGQAYVIEVEGGDSGGAEEETVDFAALFVAADVAKGERVFGKCKACHKLEAGENSTGPYLYGVVGRQVDTAQGFAYSGALEEVVDVWTPDHLNAFLENPRGYTPGTTMSFSGLKKIEERANLIAFLDQLDGDTFPMEVSAPAEEEAAMEAEPAATEEAMAEEAPAEEAATAEEAPAEEAATAEEAPAEEAAAATEMAAAEPAAEETPATEAAAEDTAAAAEGASGFAALVAAADVSKGKKVYNKCRACHVLEAGKNRVGPYLHNVVDRDIAAAEGFKYSDTLEGLEGVWTYDELNAFLEKPKDYAPGTTMSFAGLKKEEDRAAVIAYIESESQ